MKEDASLQKIEEMWPPDLQSADQDLLGRLWSSVSAAVAEHPHSSRLWCIRGDLLQFSGDLSGVHATATEFLNCYLRAIKLDPNSWYAHESVAYVLDIYLERFDEALYYFEKSLSLGAGTSSYIGRARVLAEMGRESEAVESLSQASCPYYNHAEIMTVLNDIKSGVWSSC